ncbi:MULTISPECIES: hypothetical protein [unclassified Pseudoalteromonas]|uniref:hypothetical protein n=1 Tax=unclassified Pseudoalteromonas TaxID=194690 RepID=UPI0013FDF39E|nr:MULTISPECIES: hypothetical protein [unclassified Pseudoalteromonas]MBH0014424.1 hypothetical protein [Pseudoalteromonas sp. NZS100_1]MBH0052478.1 hypothetical protein [Pseudoalteromonas sp. SWYJZ19]MBH0077980.1 hypothetical protein [Pseudoalteromonas sp. SWYJ118]
MLLNSQFTIHEISTSWQYDLLLPQLAIDGKQMSDDWVTDKRLQKAGLSRKERAKILKAIRTNDGSVEKILIRNTPDGNLLVKELNKLGNIIGTPQGF